MAALRVEFATREHPIGAAVRDVAADLCSGCERLIEAGREQGAIPRGTWPHARSRWPR